MIDPGQIGVTFKSDQYRLLGTLFLARGRQPNPTAILLHGVPGIEKNYDLAHTLRLHGWNSLIFHYRGCWGSQGVYSMETIPTDVQAAVEYLESGRHPEIDQRKIFLVGHSLGGWAAVLAAAADRRVQGLAVYGAVTDLETLIFPHSYIAEEFTPWLQGISAYEFARQWQSLGPAFSPLRKVQTLTAQPLLIIHSLNDEVVPFTQAERLHELAAGNSKLVSHQTGGHSFIWFRSWLIETIHSWLDQQA